MLFNTKWLFCAQLLLIVEASINVCIPPFVSDSEAISTSDLLEEFKNVTTEGLAFFQNYPDFNATHIDLNVIHPAISVQGTLDDILIYNLTDYEICFLNNFQWNDTLSLDVFNITFRNIIIEGLYDITGDIGDLFDIYGKGNFWMEMKNFSVAMSSSLDHSCFAFEINIRLAEVENEFSDFMEDPDLKVLFNGLIHSLLPEIFEIIWGEIKEGFENGLKDAILQLPSLSKLLKTLANITHGQQLDWSGLCYTP